MKQNSCSFSNILTQRSQKLKTFLDNLTDLPIETLNGRLEKVGSGNRLISMVTRTRLLCLGGVFESSAITSKVYELAVQGDTRRLALTCIQPLSGSM